jgi:hypothetical protein
MSESGVFRRFIGHTKRGPPQKQHRMLQAPEAAVLWGLEKNRIKKVQRSPSEKESGLFKYSALFAPSTPHSPRHLPQDQKAKENYGKRIR